MIQIIVSNHIIAYLKKKKETTLQTRHVKSIVSDNSNKNFSFIPRLKDKDSTQNLRTETMKMSKTDLPSSPGFDLHEIYVWSTSPTLNKPNSYFYLVSFCLEWIIIIMSYAHQMTKGNHCNLNFAIVCKYNIYLHRQRLMALKTLSLSSDWMFMCPSEGWASFEGLYFSTYKMDFDETWWMSWKLGPTYCIIISWKLVITSYFLVKLMQRQWYFSVKDFHDGLC